MARQLRIEYEGGFYHVISRGNNRQKIFRQPGDYLHFLDLLTKNKDRFSCQIHSYVLMRNHYHLLIETHQANLSRIMHALNAGYGNYFRVKHGYSGHIFQGRYKALIVDKEQYLLELSRYIHLNPYRAKMEAQIGEYRWSSILEYKNNKKDAITYAADVLGYFRGSDREKRKRYLQFVADGMDDSAMQKDPLKEVYGGFAVGKVSFLKEMLGVINERRMCEDIAFRNKIREAVDITSILQKTAGFYGVDKNKLTKSVKQSVPGRKQALYLMKRLSGLSNSEIGKLFGVSYSAVSKTVFRYEQEVAENRHEQNRLEKLMSHVKS